MTGVCANRLGSGPGARLGRLALLVAVLSSGLTGCEDDGPGLPERSPPVRPAVAPRAARSASSPPLGLSADVAMTPKGLRLRAPLGFLRAGMTVRLGEEGRVLRGRVRGALLGPSEPGEAPVLQLDIEPASR